LPAQKAQVIGELRHKHKLSLLLEVTGLARSTYYYHAKKQTETDKYSSVKEELVAVFHENKGRYGYRRVTKELHNRGYHINHKTVQRLMKELHLICCVRLKKYRSYRGEVGKIATNLLDRNFVAIKPNEKWVTDVTEFSLFGQKLYLSPVLDLYNGEIVSYSLSYHPNFELTVDMLKKAFCKIPSNTGLILHSDQGWQYQMKPYQRMLKEKGIRQSMSRKGNCLDNAVIENFFGILKTELFYLQTFDSTDHFIAELKDYIQYYNNRRIKQKLKGMSPVQFRVHTLQSA
jgi:Transposase and inactivated derivatives